jgi:Domain of unknown function (DUF4345)
MQNVTGADESPTLLDEGFRGSAQRSSGVVPVNRRQVLLLVAAIGLIPIALSYGLAPSRSLESLFDVSIDNVNGTHMFRAVMGLYLAIATFWIIGVIRTDVRQAALYSLVVFMLGLAAGRTLSLVVDGWPNWLLVAYLVVEVVFGVLGVKLLKDPEDNAVDGQRRPNDLNE